MHIIDCIKNQWSALQFVVAFPLLFRWMHMNVVLGKSCKAFCLKLIFASYKMLIFTESIINCWYLSFCFSVGLISIVCRKQGCCCCCSYISLYLYVYIYIYIYIERERERETIINWYMLIRTQPLFCHTISCIWRSFDKCIYI